MLMPSIFGENLFDEFFDFPDFDKMQRRMEKRLYGGHANGLMKCDVKDLDDAYELVLDLPGFTKDEVTADIHDGCLTITAAKGLDEDKKDQKSGRYLRRERFAGVCQRSFYVGEDIRKEDVKAKFQHGLLTLTVPKKPALPQENPHRILIE